MLIIKIWKKQPGEYFCISTKSPQGLWEDHFFTPDRFEEIPDFIKDYSQNDIYFCPHGFSQPRRKKQFAVPPNLLYADLDEVDGLTLGDLEPTICIESSPGRQVGLWELIGGSMTEELNRQLTYHIGADKGGWDLTQVLRFPGTRNYKYTSAPKVKILKKNGPKYAVSKIQKLIPKEIKVEGSNKKAIDLYKKYESKLKPFVRRELLNGKPIEGKRSEVFWRLAQELMESGLSINETMILLKASPWNKFRGRQREDEQIKREINKVIDGKVKPADIDNDDLKPHKFFAKSLKDVEQENTDWLWYGVLARGEVTLVTGNPGVGKSFITQYATKCLVDGISLPSEKKNLKRLSPMNVLLCDPENSMAAVTKKRFVNMGTKNLHRIFQDETAFSLLDETWRNSLYEGIEKHRPGLITFDTLNNFTGGIDTNHGSTVQQLMNFFKEIAIRYNCAVAVIRHMTKGARDTSIFRGQGNVAIIGSARLEVVITRDEDDPDGLILSQSKNNVGRHIRPQVYKRVELPSTLNDDERVTIEFEGFSDKSTEELVNPVKKEESEVRSEACEEWLTRELERSGQIEANALKEEAQKRSFSARTLNNAAKKLNIRKEKQGSGKGSKTYWKMP